MTDTLSHSPLLRALSGEIVTPPPVWLMRQAGRYLPEYRALRADAGGFMAMVFNPALASEITLQPLRRFPQIDAAILFSDILVIPYALGLDVQFVKGEGPTMPAMSENDIALQFDPDKLLPIYDTLRLVKQQLSSDKTLIGFAGSPWTVACYMIAGRNHDDFLAAKHWAFAAPDKLKALLVHIVDATVHYLCEQIKAGADVVQLFESWAGLLSGHTHEFHDYIVKPTQAIITRVKQAYPDIPIIGFPRIGGPHMIIYAQETGVNGLGLDWSVDLHGVIEHLPAHLTLQGNLDPAVLLSGGDILIRKTQHILNMMKDRPFIFNLGHGVMPSIPIDHVQQLLELVKNHAY